MVEPYTNVPNKLFDVFNEIENGEIRLLLSTIRHTVGYHRLEWETNVIDLTNLLRITRPSVEKAIDGLTNKKVIGVSKKRNSLTIYFDTNSIKNDF